MNLDKSTTRAWVVSPLLVLALVLGGAAAAYWSARGTGTGNGDTGSTMPVTLTAGAPARDLHPGGVADVLLTITNPNPTSVTVQTLNLDVAQGIDGFSFDGPHAACGLESLEFRAQNNSGAGWIVPNRVGSIDGVLDVTLVGPLAMDLQASNACQDAIITVHLKAGTS